MDLYFIDYLASNGHSFFHKASAVPKMIFSMSIIIAIIMSNRPSFLAFLLLFLLLLLKILRQPVLKILAMTFYVAVFAIIFAVSQISGSFLWPLTIILKAVTAALSVLIVLTTTNYFDIFAVLAHFLPKLIADSLFMTYRSFFILLKELKNLTMAVKVKRGLSPRKIFTNLKSLGDILGVLFIHAVDLSSRSSEILAIRGYKGGMAKYRSLRCFSKYDFAPLILSVAALLGVGIFG